PVVLNRPLESAEPGAVRADMTLGESVRLDSFTASLTRRDLCLALVWSASPVPNADYQIFVHLLDSNSEVVAQVDRQPVDGRYPTRWWRDGVLVRDTYHVTFETSLPDGEYQVAVGMYRLDTLARLDVSGDTLPVSDNRILVLNANPDAGGSCEDA